MNFAIDSGIIRPLLDVEKWQRIVAKLSPGEVTTWLHAYLGYAHVHLGVAQLVYV